MCRIGSIVNQTHQKLCGKIRFILASSTNGPLAPLAGQALMLLFEPLRMSSFDNIIKILKPDARKTEK